MNSKECVAMIYASEHSAGLGALATAAYGLVQGWSIQLPWGAMGVGVGASLVIGALAGSYPAARAARVPPTESLRTV